MNIISTITNVRRAVQLEVAARQVCALNEASKKIEAMEILERADALAAAREARSAKLEATRSAIKQIRDIWTGRVTVTTKSDSTPVM